MNQETLKKLIRYCPETGLMVWRERPSEFFTKDWVRRSWNTKYAGKKAGVIDSKGYLAVFIMGKQYRQHRLAWLYVYGKDPVAIDHINGIRTDNRLCNLREVTNQQNHMNRRISSANTSGVTGVYLNKKRNLWCAQMKFNGKTYHLGSSKVFEEAVAMRRKEESLLGFSERHGENYAYPL